MKTATLNVFPKAVVGMIRPYQSEDKLQVLALFRSNVPAYFAAEEEQELIDYLANDSAHYHVLLHEGKIVGAGGINYGFDEGKTARIAWDIIHPDAQGKGFGSTLLHYRIEVIKKVPVVTNIVVRTSQLVANFYAKNGFELQSVTKDYWAPGFDLYLMQQPVSH